MLYFFTYKSSPSLSIDIVADIRCVGNRCDHDSLCGGQQAVALAANALRHAARVGCLRRCNIDAMQ